jgi:hypothetical protein
VYSLLFYGGTDAKDLTPENFSVMNHGGGEEANRVSAPVNKLAETKKPNSVALVR